MIHDGYRGNVSKMLFEAMDVFFHFLCFSRVVWKINYKFFLTSKNERISDEPILVKILLYRSTNPTTPHLPHSCRLQGKCEIIINFLASVVAFFWWCLPGRLNCGFFKNKKNRIASYVFADQYVVCSLVWLLFCTRFAVLWSQEVFHQKKKVPLFFVLNARSLVYLDHVMAVMQGSCVFSSMYLSIVFLQPPACFQFELQNTKA